MTSRDSILQAVRRRQISTPELPDLSGPWSVYEDRVAQFIAVLESVGGRAFAGTSADAEGRLSEMPAYTTARRVISRVPGVGRSTEGTGVAALDAVNDPHQLEDVDFAILPGEFAVCENGAVWVDDRALAHRALYFIVQHLALVVPKAELVHTMHEAYERLDFNQRGFGAFISGPSKTADIEQSLVIGAHGPRSLTVFLL